LSSDLAHLRKRVEGLDGSSTKAVFATKGEPANFKIEEDARFLVVILVIWTVIPALLVHGTCHRRDAGEPEMHMLRAISDVAHALNLIEELSRQAV
jgi:hypothetical protein